MKNNKIIHEMKIHKKKKKKIKTIKKTQSKKQNNT